MPYSNPVIRDEQDEAEVTLASCSTCKRTLSPQNRNALGMCQSCVALCELVPEGWTNKETTFRKQRPDSVHPKDWLLDPANGYIDRDVRDCWNWLPGQHHAPQASPSLFTSPLAPEMAWAVRGRAGRQVPAYYLFLRPPPEGMREPEADHLCCNRRCVNPDHIEWTSKAENTRRNAVRAAFSELRAGLQAEGRWDPHWAEETVGTRDVGRCAPGPAQQAEPEATSAPQTFEQLYRKL